MKKKASLAGLGLGNSGSAPRQVRQDSACKNVPSSGAKLGAMTMYCSKSAWDGQVLESMGQCC